MNRTHVVFVSLTYNRLNCLPRTAKHFIRKRAPEATKQLCSRAEYAEQASAWPAFHDTCTQVKHTGLPCCTCGQHLGRWSASHQQLVEQHNDALCRRMHEPDSTQWHVAWYLCCVTPPSSAVQSASQTIMSQLDLPTLSDLALTLIQPGSNLDHTLVTGKVTGTEPSWPVPGTAQG